MLLTLKKLAGGHGKYWCERPPNSLSSLEILAWHAAKELASWIEMHLEDPGTLQKDCPQEWMVLMGLDEYFKDIGVLPSHPHAAVMLMNQRRSYYLTSRGDEAKRE